MDSVFQKLDRAASDAFWEPALAVPEDSDKVFVQTEPGVFMQTRLEVRPPFLHCFSDTQSKRALLTWKRLEAFTDIYSNKVHFGFTLFGHNETAEFFTTDESSLVKWLDALAPLCINSAFKEDYEVTGVIREHRIFLCQHRLTHQEFAVKRFHKINEATEAQREVCSLRKLKHPGVIELETVYEDSCFVYVVMRLAEQGNLFDYVTVYGPLRSAEIKPLVLSLAELCSYLENERVVCQSITPKHLLLSSDCRQFKLCDFSQVDYLKRELRPGEYSAFIGEAMLFMFTGELHGSRILLSSLPPFVSRIIQELTRVNPSHRLTPTRLQRHHWLNMSQPIARSFTHQIQFLGYTEDFTEDTADTDDLRLYREDSEEADISLPPSRERSPGEQFSLS